MKRLAVVLLFVLVPCVLLADADDDKETSEVEPKAQQQPLQQPQPQQQQPQSGGSGFPFPGPGKLASGFGGGAAKSFGPPGPSQWHLCMCMQSGIFCGMQMQNPQCKGHSLYKCTAALYTGGFVPAQEIEDCLNPQAGTYRCDPHRLVCSP